MGAIQGSINNMLGTAAIAAAAGKHAIEQKDANEMQKAQLSAQAIEKGEEIKALQKEAETIQNETPELTAVDFEDRLKIEEAEGGSDLANASKAMNEVIKKVAAKERQKKMLEEAFGNVGKSPLERFGGILEEKAQRLTGIGGRK